VLLSSIFIASFYSLQFYTVYLFSKMCITAYSYNTSYRIQRVLNRIEQIGPYYNLPIIGLFTLLKRPFSELSMLLYNILLEKDWRRQLYY